MEPILTQYEVMIDLSIPAMERIAVQLLDDSDCEVWNFKNLLLNLIERGVGRALTDEELCS